MPETAPYTPQFYAPWPKLGGKKVKNQLNEIRVDTENLLPLMRAAGFDDSSLNAALDHALQAWEVGNKGFHNRFRIFYDSSATRFKIQRNAGTEASPTWVDTFSIDSSGVIRDANGNILGSSSASTVTWTDGANTITSNELNVNASQFYLSKDLSGNPVLNFFGSSGGGAVDGASNVNVGGVGVFEALSGTTLQFRGVNAGSSKITVTSDGANKEIDIDVAQANLDHGSIGGLTDDDHTQYILVDGTRAFTGAQSMGSNRLTNVGAPTAGTDAARLQDISPGFYGIIVKESDDSIALKNDTISFLSADFNVTQVSGKPQVALVSSSASGGGFYGITVKETDDSRAFKGINLVSVDANYFYITQNAPNTDEVSIHWNSQHPDNQGFNLAQPAVTLSAVSPITVAGIDQSGGPTIPGTIRIYRRLEAGQPENQYTDIWVNDRRLNFHSVQDESGNTAGGFQFDLGGSSSRDDGFLVTKQSDFSGVDPTNILFAVYSQDPSGLGTGGAASINLGASNPSANLHVVGTALITSYTTIQDKLKARNITSAGGFYSISFGETAYKSDINPGFYGISVKQSDNLAKFKNINTLAFNTDSFYLEQNATNTDEVMVNFRGTAGGSGEANTISSAGGTETLVATPSKVGVDLQTKGLTAGAGISLSSDSSSVTITATGSATGDPGFYGIIVKESDNSIALRDDTISFVSADFDVTDTSNKPQVAISSNIARLTDIGPGFYGIIVKDSGNSVVLRDDTIVFTAADFTVANTSNKPTISLATTVARLTDIGPGFYGIVVKESDDSIALRDDTIVFSSTDFIVADVANKPTISLVTSPAAPSPGFYGIIVKESDNSIALRDDTISFLSADFDVTDTSNKPQVAVSSSIARLTDIGPGFYGISVKHSNNTAKFRGINTIAFHVNNFYLEQNTPNTDEVMVNWRANFGHITPTADNTFNVGFSGNRFAEVNSNKGLFTGGTGTKSLSVTGLLFGEVTNSGTIQNAGRGCFVGGYANGTNAKIYSTANASYAVGATVLGAVGSGGTAAISEIKAASNSYGSFISGYIYSNNAAAVSRIHSTSKGTFTQGYISSSATTTILASNAGAFAQGMVTNTSGTRTITSSGVGSFAQGYVDANALGNSGTAGTTITSSGSGSFAQGIVKVVSGTGVAYIKASGSGAFAHGTVLASNGYTANIRATSLGAMAIGYANNYAIIASQAGSFAGGATPNGNISCSGIGAFQWGVGTNATNYLFQIGTTFAVNFGTPAIGLFNVTPVARSTGWSVTNVTTDKTYDADATTVAELADVLGTLIDYLKSRGDLGA